MFHCEETTGFLDLLGKIRSSLIRLLIIEFITVILLLLFPERLFEISLSPVKSSLAESRLIFTDVFEKFLTHLKLAFWWSTLIFIPLLLIEAIYIARKKVLIPRKALSYAVISILLFYSGFLLSWYLLVPKLVKFSLSLIWSETQLLPKLKNTVTLSIKLSLYTGICLQLPLILHFLVNHDLLSRGYFKRNLSTIAFVLIVKNVLILPLDLILQIFISLIEITIIYMMLLLLDKKGDN